MRVLDKKLATLKPLETPLKLGVIVVAAHSGTKSGFVDEDCFDEFVAMRQQVGEKSRDGLIDQVTADQFEGAQLVGRKFGCSFGITPLCNLERGGNSNYHAIRQTILPCGGIEKRYHLPADLRRRLKTLRCPW